MIWSKNFLDSFLASSKISFWLSLLEISLRRPLRLLICCWRESVSSVEFTSKLTWSVTEVFHSSFWALRQSLIMESYLMSNFVQSGEVPSAYLKLSLEISLFKISLLFWAFLMVSRRCSKVSNPGSALKAATLSLAFEYKTSTCWLCSLHACL